MDPECLHHRFWRSARSLGAPCRPVWTQEDVSLGRSDLHPGVGLVRCRAKRRGPDSGARATSCGRSNAHAHLSRTVLAAFPIEMRAIAVTLWGAVGGLAAALGPSAGAFLIQSLGWRSAFYINLPIGLLAFVLGARMLRESRDITARALPDFVGVVLLIASVGLVTLGIVASEAWGWLDVHTLGFVLAGVVLLLAFVRRSLRVVSPALDLSLFADANYRFSNLATFLFAIAFFAMFLGNVLFLTQIWQYSTFKAGLAILPAPLMVIPVAVLSGRVANRYGHRVLVIPGGIVFALAGISLLLRAGTTPTYVSVWLPSSVLVGLGVGLC